MAAVIAGAAYANRPQPAAAHARPQTPVPTRPSGEKFSELGNQSMAEWMAKNNTNNELLKARQDRVKGRSPSSRRSG